MQLAHAHPAQQATPWIFHTRPARGSWPQETHTWTALKTHTCTAFFECCNVRHSVTAPSHSYNNSSNGRNNTAARQHYNHAPLSPAHNSP